jgi:TrmH family RNA methyltransferase
MERLDSVKNPLIQRLRSLKTSEGRQAENLFLVEGEKLMREAAALLAPSVALFEEGLDHGDLPALLSARGARPLTVPPPHPGSGVRHEDAPGRVRGVLRPPEPLALDRPPMRIVALDGVQDPGNLGASGAPPTPAGFQALVAGPGCAEALSPKVQRAAMGSGFRIPFAKVEDLGAYLAALAGKGYDVVATSLNGAPFYERSPLPGAVRAGHWKRRPRHSARRWPNARR